VTEGRDASGVGGAIDGSVLAFRFFNCWTGSIGFNNLDSMGNSVLIQQMTVHHEGFEIFWGDSSRLLDLGNTGP
jgi:hypothetical protein